MIGLKTTGTSKGSEHFGTEIRNYTGLIYLKTRLDFRDLYNEKFDKGITLKQEAAHQPT
jgi:hypothetical protein